MLILLTDKVFCGCMRSRVQKCRVPSLLTDTYLPAPLLSVVSSVPCDTLGRCVIRVIVSRWQLKQRIVIQLQTWKFFSKINQLFFYDIIRDAFCSLDVSTLNSSPVPHFSTGLGLWRRRPVRITFLCRRGTVMRFLLLLFMKSRP